MDIRVGSTQPDSDRYTDTASKKKRLKTKGSHDEEAWSERSDFEEIEDVYTPSPPAEEEAGE